MNLFVLYDYLYLYSFLIVWHVDSLAWVAVECPYNKISNKYEIAILLEKPTRAKPRLSSRQQGVYLLRLCGTFITIQTKKYLERRRKNELKREKE